MKAIQIVIKDDPRSEEYAELSRESFRPALRDGHITSIETFDAITPESDTFQEHIDKYVWSKSLMDIDLKSGKEVEDHSPTEKAGMCSHWEIMRMVGESDERVWVMEHDTYLLYPERYESFRANAALAPNTLYANIGLFMGMYSLDPRFARWAYHMLTENDFPINCGPYCVMQRLFRTYTTVVLKKPEVDYFGMPITAIHPWHNCDTLGYGRDIFGFFNKNDFNENHAHSVPTPTTQLISKRLSVTQDHHGYKQKAIDEPWTRHRFFAVID